MKKNIIIISLGLLSNVALAGGMGGLQALYDSQVVAVSIGPDFVRAGEGQAITLLPPFQNYYTNTNGAQTIADGGLFLGVERSLSNSWNFQFGLAGYLTSSSTIKGHVWQFSLPDFDNLAYDYRINNKRLMVSSKLLSTKFKAFHPYISAEIGIAYNQANAYQETPFIPEVVPMRPFTSHSINSFAFGAGVGIDYDASAHVRLGIGYQFANLGKTRLGVSPSQLTNETLDSHGYANQMRFQLTYLI